MSGTLTDYRKRAGRAAADYDHARRTYRAEKENYTNAKRGLRDARTAQDIVQRVAAEIQETAHARIASVVSRCLAAVFDRPYEFEIVFERARGKTAAVLQFKRGELEIDPMDAAGGGVIDVAAFALRVAGLILSRPPLRRLLVLDEPFSHCKPPEVLAPRICRLVETLAAEFSIQFIIVPSVEDHYRIGKVIEI